MKYLKLTLLSFIILFITQFSNLAYAKTYNGIDIGHLDTLNIEQLTNITIYDYDVDNYYVILGRNSQTINLSFDETNGFSLTGQNFGQYGLVDKETKVCTKVEKLFINNVSTTEFQDNILVTTNDIKLGTVLYKKANLLTTTKIGHNTKFQIKNITKSIMENSDYNLQFPQNTSGSVLLTNAYGKFIEQISFTGTTTVKFKIPHGEIYNIYLQLDLDSIGNTANISILSYFRTFDFVFYKPQYEIIGQLLYEINGSDNITAEPYLKPLNADALILLKEENPNLANSYITKDYIIRKGETFFLPKTKKSIFQFMHPPGSSILVESNFDITTTTETMPILPKEVIDSLVEGFYGGGLIPDEPSTQDTTLIATPNQSIKISTLGLSEKLISQMVDAYIVTSNGTTGKIEWFGKDINWKPTGDEPIRKKMQRNITDTMNNKQKRISIGQYEYVIFTADTGSINIRIPSKFKLNEDFNIEVIKNYIVSPEYEDEFITNNPTIPDFGDTNDVYSKDINDNMYDWITGNAGYDGSTPGELGLPSITNIGQQITSFTDMMIAPIKTLFTGIPEIYTLIIFGFGLSIVMFVLGR